MNMLEYLAYIEMPDKELKEKIAQNPLLIRALQRNCPAPEFIPRLIRSALEISVDHLRHIVTPGHSKVIIDFLLGLYESPRSIANALIKELPARAVDQAMFDYVIRLEKTFSLKDVPPELLTTPNILSAVMIDANQISYIPDEVFTPELSLEVFKVVPSAYCCLSPLVSTEDVVLACTNYYHLSHLNNDHFEAFYERWRYTSDMLKYGWNRPTSANITLRTLYAAYKLPSHTSQDKAMRQGSIRLMKRSLLDDGVEKVWPVADSSSLQELVKDLFGKDILKIRNVPIRMKRDFLSDDLGM